MKSIAVLGSTGSVGVTTLDVIARFPDRFRVCALAAGRNLGLLREQVLRFRPALVSVATPGLAREMTERLGAQGKDVTILVGIEGATAVATCPDAELVVSALVGAMGLRPTLAAIAAGKDIAFANKEVLVVAGELVMRSARTHGVNVLPVDSEQNAIFQCLEGRDRVTLKRVILTASGGPFRTLDIRQFASITVDDALKHPTWNMGHKITIDSATLMNKGLEVIEAHWLFGLEPERIDVVIHPQSVIHSMVELVDGSVIAEMAVPDMAIPVAYALAFPDRLPLGHLKPLSLIDCGMLTFERPDFDRFPALRLAYEALRAGGTMAACMNAANEEMVAAFLGKRASYNAIARNIESVMERYKNRPAESLEDLLEADSWARAKSRELREAGAGASATP
jgi:1-deoxy-D-xylulose-5-phosphate reductoisomerase